MLLKELPLRPLLQTRPLLPLLGKNKCVLKKRRARRPLGMLLPLTLQQTRPLRMLLLLGRDFLRKKPSRQQLVTLQRLQALQPQLQEIPFRA